MKDLSLEVQLSEEERFYRRYERLLRTALRSGSSYVAMRDDKSNPFYKTNRHFMKACHRGFDIAQREVVSMLLENIQSPLGVSEKLRREILLRKVIDAIAVTLVGGEMTTIKRMCYLDTLAPIQQVQIQKYLTIANVLNESNRSNFTLIADLSTFLHVGDLLKFSPGSLSGKMEIVELKTGVVNEQLLPMMNEYAEMDDWASKVDEDPRLANVHQKKQLKRMVRQLHRSSSASYAIRNDKGTDLATGAKVRHLEPIEEVVTYLDMLRDGWLEARNVGVSAFTVNYCLHIGVGASGFRCDAKTLARDAATLALNITRNTYSEISDSSVNLRREIGDVEDCQGFDVLERNLNTGAAFPFLLWGDDLTVQMDLIKGDLVTVAVFDLAAFLWLCSELEIKTQWSSGRKAAEVMQAMKKRNVLAWNDRLVEINGTYLGPGFWQRIFCELITPYTFLVNTARPR